MPRPKRTFGDAPLVETFGQIIFTINTEQSRPTGKKEAYTIPAFVGYPDDLRKKIVMMANLRANMLTTESVITNIQIKLMPGKQWGLDVFDGEMYGNYKKELFAAEEQAQKISLALGAVNEANQPVNTDFKLETLLTPNSPMDALTFKFQNKEQGVYNIRHFHGIPDLWISNFESAMKGTNWLGYAVPAIPTGDAVANIPASPNYVTNVQRFISFLAQETKVIRRAPNNAQGVKQYFLGQANLIVYNWVANVKAGGPSGVPRGRS